MGDNVNDYLAEEVEGITDPNNPVIARLVQAWCNEKVAPELLPYRADLMNKDTDTLLMQVNEQQNNLAQQAIPDIYVRGLYQLDIDRIKFVMTSYLRTRLGKVQRWFRFIETNSEMKSRLSPSERTFLEDYSRAQKSLLDTAVLQHLPAGARNLTAGGGGESTAEDTLTSGPLLTHYVPIIVKEEIDQPTWVPQEGENAVKGQTYIVPYEKVKVSVLERDVELR